MSIPSYQIHNILDIFVQRLIWRADKNDAEKLGVNFSHVLFRLSPEGKRRAMTDKVVEDIVDRITDFGPDIETADEKSTDEHLR